MSDPFQVSSSLVGGVSSSLLPEKSRRRAKEKAEPALDSGARASTGADATKEQSGQAFATSQTPVAGTFLRFQVDAIDDSVTVLIIDAASREVIRTVPPEELVKMGYDRIVDILT